MINKISETESNKVSLKFLVKKEITMGKKNIFLVFFIILFTVSPIKTMEQYLDTTFGDNGIVVTDFGMNSGTFNRIASSLKVKIQSDKKIVIAGDRYKVMGSRNAQSNFALVRYTQDGNLDEAFGDHGLLAPSITQGDKSSFGVDMALQKDGKFSLL